MGRKRQAAASQRSWRPHAEFHPAADLATSYSLHQHLLEVAGRQAHQQCMWTEEAAREDTRLLVISRQDVPRLPVKTMQAFTEARRRHDYHSSLHAFKVSKASKSSGAPSSDALGQRQPSSSRLASPMQARFQSPPAPVAPQSEPLPELPLPFMMAGGLGGPIGVSYAEKHGHEQDDQGQVELRTNKEVERDGSMGPFAGAQPLSSTQSVDSLMVPLKVLTMGRKAATDSNVSRRLARQHKIERWFMQETLAKRKPSALRLH